MEPFGKLRINLQQKLNQGTNVRSIVSYPFLNRRIVISGIYQRLKIIQLLPGHFILFFLLEKHLLWLNLMKALTACIPTTRLEKRKNRLKRAISFGGAPVHIKSY